MKKPKVSVIMATYNHGPYVADAIRSVLDQDFTDFEFIIADDGSTDNTREVVATVTDPRVKFFPNLVNRGACIVTNELIGRSTGEYVALMNSDDRWLPAKLTRQVKFLDSQCDIGATFGRARFIDKAGMLIDPGTLVFGKVFDQKNRTRGEWARRFFDEGNCLCHPSILIRRSVYEAIGLYNNRYRQLPDFEMWIRLIKGFDIHVSEVPEIEFRIMPGENASSQTRLNSVRTMNEHFLIAKSFFSSMSTTLLRQGFADQLVYKNIPTAEHLEIEKGLLFFGKNSSLGKTYELVGLEKLFDLIQVEDTRLLLAKEYHIDDRTFQKWTSEFDVLRPVSDPRGPRIYDTNTKGLAREIARRMRTRLIKISRR